MISTRDTCQVKYKVKVRVMLLNYYFIHMLCLRKEGFHLSLLTRMIILCFYYASSISLQIMRYTKNIYNCFVDMQKKSKGSNISPIVVYSGTWIQSVIKESNVLGQIYPEAAISQQPNSRSKKKAKVDIKLITILYKKGLTIGFILYGILKGERKRNTTKDQYVIECPYHGIHECVKNFCVANN